MPQRRLVDPAEFADEPAFVNPLNQPVPAAAPPAPTRRAVSPAEFADTPAPAKEPDFLDKLGMAGGVSGLWKTAKDVVTGAPGAREGFAQGAGEAAKAIAPTGIRMLSGILGVEGGPIGAGISGVGETGAQMLEPGKMDPARIAVATGAGAIPFGSVVKGGRVAASALRSGALSGGSELAREALSGEKIDPKALALSTGMGAAGGAAGSGLARMFGASEKLPTKAPAAVAEDTGLAARAAERLRAAEQANPDRMKANVLATKEIQRDQKNLSDVLKWRASKEATAAKSIAAQTAQDRIDQAIAEGGLEPGAPRISENAAGKKSMSTPYGPPTEEGTAQRLEKGFTPEQYAEFNRPETSNFSDILGPEGPKPAFDWPEAGGRFTPDATGSHVTAPPVEAPQTPLAKFFKTPAGAAGANYGEAKAAEKAGEIPSADLAHEAFARERAKLGQETAPRTRIPVSPEELAPQTPPGGNWVQDQTDLADAATQEPSLRQRLLDLAKGEQGSARLPNISSGLAKQLVGGGVGAAVGAPIGSYAYGEDDSLGGVKGGLIGAGLGAGVMAPTGRGIVNNALNLRGGSMLSNPGTVAKSYLGDQGGMFWEGLKQLITPGETQYGKDILSQMPVLNPRQAAKDWVEGMKLHTPSRTTMGEGQQATPNSLLDLVYRPLGASNYMTREAMTRAGTPPGVIERISGISDPETAPMKQLVALQGKNPMFRAMWPFLRVASNVAEGARNIPGVSLMAGNPADKWQRTAIGGLQAGLGAGSELYDEANAEAGTPTSNLSKGSRAATMGIGGVAPYAAGYAGAATLRNTSADAIRELLQLLPGSQATFTPPYPGESTQDYLLRVGGKVGGSFVPSFVKPDPGTVR